MEHQEAIYFLIMVALVLGIGNTYYIVRYLARTPRARLEDSNNAHKDTDKSSNIKD